MTKNSLIHIFTLVGSLTFLGTVSYSQDKPIKKDLKITVIPKNINNPYMVIQDGGVTDACKELGIEGKVEGPSEAGASAQVSYINTAITQRRNAILIEEAHPDDRSAIKSAQKVAAKRRVESAARLLKQSAGAFLEKAGDEQARQGSRDSRPPRRFAPSGGVAHAH